MKYYLISGEASGDLHGSNLMKAIREQDEHAEFRFWGGDKMAEVGGKPVKHIKELAFMGFIEVIMNLRTILKNIRFCKKNILEFKPDVLLLIDYPGFNLRIAEFAHENGIKVHYYISPQIWAWKQKRGFKIKKWVDEMYCILPFEKEFYKKFEMDVHYVGHPLIDAIQQFKKNALHRTSFFEKYKIENKHVLALLPGSRQQEIKIKLPIMLQAAKNFPDYEILIAGAPNIEKEFYQNLANGIKIHVIPNQTYDLLNNSDLAMVTSGTATLETALFKVPQVVCYKGSSISYQIAKRLIKVKYISLVNLIMDQEVVKELIQADLTSESITNQLNLLKDRESSTYKELQHNYEILENNLGGGGASSKVASLLINKIRK